MRSVKRYIRCGRRFTDNVLNKIDLPSAEPEKVKAQIEDMIGIPADDALPCSAKTGMGISILIVLLNIPFILLGYHQIGRNFVVKTTLGILLLALCVAGIEFPVLTNDKLLISVFGGFFLGAGIGLTIRGGAVIDGTEVLAISVSKRSFLSVGDFIALFNITLFLFAILLINIETAMYSMLTYLSASKTADFILNGVEEYIGVMIISEHHNKLKEVISKFLGK